MCFLWRQKRAILRAAAGWRAGAPLEEPADLLGGWVKVDVVETGSGGQTGHGAHLGETPQKKQLYLKNTLPDKCSLKTLND